MFKKLNNYKSLKFCKYLSKKKCKNNKKQNMSARNLKIKVQTKIYKNRALKSKKVVETFKVKQIFKVI